MHNVDELLDDIGLNLSAAARARQWLVPADPSDYRALLPRLVARLRRSGHTLHPASGLSTDPPRSIRGLSV